MAVLLPHAPVARVQPPECCFQCRLPAFPHPGFAAPRFAG